MPRPFDVSIHHGARQTQPVATWTHLGLARCTLRVPSRVAMTNCIAYGEAEAPAFVAARPILFLPEIRCVRDAMEFVFPALI